MLRNCKNAEEVCLEEDSQVEGPTKGPEATYCRSGCWAATPGSGIVWSLS